MRVQKDRQWFLSSNLCASYSCGWLYYSVYYIHAHTHYHTHIQCLYNHVLALVVFFLIFQDDFLTFKHLWLLCSSDHQCRDLDWAFQHSLSLRLIVYSLYTSAESFSTCPSSYCHPDSLKHCWQDGLVLFVLQPGGKWFLWLFIFLNDI